MIANVALQTTDAASAVNAVVETGDTGAFDTLLAIQAQMNALIAGEPDAELLADTLEDSAEDFDDEGEFADDALSFFTALLPTPRISQQVTTGPASTRADDIQQSDLGAILQAARQPPTIDIEQIFASDASAGGEADLPAFMSNIFTAAPVIETTTWNSLAGPAELFAQGVRQPSERVESAPLTTHVRDPRWADELGNRLASMVRTGDSSASLQLTPVDLGPLEVNVAVRDNQATVHFGAANAETRALLEASIPRLREMLESQGFQLMDSSVSHGFAKSTRHEAAGTPRVNDLGESPTISAPTIHITGLLDIYA